MEAAARGGIATIVVGPEGVKYLVHKAVLMEHSAYFEKALQGPWKEAEEGVVCLDDVEPVIFGIFIDWIYSQRVPRLGFMAQTSTMPHKQNFQTAWLKACILGDRLLAPVFVQAFRHDLVHHLVKHQPVSYKTIIYGFGNLATGDPLLQMMIDVYVVDITNEGYVDDEELRRHLPISFLLAVTDKFATLIRMGNRINMDVCNYHGHTSEEERKKCQKRVKESRHGCC